MVRKASKSAPAGIETAAGRETITKSEAVRRALADGAEQPSAGVAYIKSRFGLEIGPQHFSAVKAAEKKKAGTVLSRGRRKPGRRPYAVRPASSHAKPANGDAGLLESLETLKPLVAEHGVEKVKRLVELLG